MMKHMAQLAPHYSSLEKGDIHKTKLSPESEARIIHLLFTQELSVQIVARRFGVGRSTIERIRTAHYRRIDAREKDGDGR